MNIIDTHSHLYATEFDLDREDAIARAKQKNISHILLPNIDEESIRPMHRLCDEHPNYCFPMMGLHPTSVDSAWEQVLDRMYPLFQQRKYIAVGEIGMDLYWDKSFEKEQRQAFIRQIQWAKEFTLPVVIHSRDAHKETIECVIEAGCEGVTGVFHSFGGNKEQLEEILALPNFFVGINGVVTFKNSKLTDTLQAAPISRVVVETDSPYLAPVPFRGKRNESSYICQVVEKLSEVFEIPADEVARITSNNAKSLFKLEDKTA